MKKTFNAAFKIIKEAVVRYGRKKSGRLASSLAFFTLFTIAPFFLVLAAAGGILFAQAPVQAELIEHVKKIIGNQGIEAAQTILAHFEKPKEGLLPVILSVGSLLFGSINLLDHLRDALSHMWRIEGKKKRNRLELLMRPLLYIGLLGSFGILVIISFVLSWILSGLQQYVKGFFMFYQVLDVVISFSSLVVMCAIMFIFLVDTRYHTLDLWIGAGWTALMLTLGKYITAFYLGSINITSTYGAMSSIIVFLLWVYISAQIFLLGASITGVFAERKMSGNDSDD